MLETNALFTYDGTEIINTARTIAYARDGRAGWLVDDTNVDEVAALFGDAPYDSVLQDEPPWYDPDDPNTWQFYGVYLLDVTGLEDSTRSVSITESVQDGGTMSRMRFATRTVVFHALLLGVDNGAVRAGFEWLKWATTGSVCSDVSAACAGGDLCYISAIPDIDVSSLAYPNQCLDDYLRTLHGVIFTDGPQVLNKKITSDGQHIWDVQFTAVAAFPWAFGIETPIVTDMFSPDQLNPAAGAYADVGQVTIDVPCPTLLYQPMFDPLCPMLVAPPSVPNVTLSCFALPTQWIRYAIQIPANVVPTWNQLVPKVVLRTGIDGARMVRVRFYSDVLDQFDLGAIDQCSFCGDFLVSYVPPNCTFTIDGSTKSIKAETAGVVRNAASVVYGSDGGPYLWPELTCGYSYIMTVDVPGSVNVPEVDLSVFGKIA